MRTFLNAGTWETMRHHLVMTLREGTGREPTLRWYSHRLRRRSLDQLRPTAAIIDTQSVKTTESGGLPGYDAAKKVDGRKHHIAVDTQEMLLGVLVHVGSIQDGDGAGDLLQRIKPLYCWLPTVFADGIYNRVTALLACFLLGIMLVIVRRIPGAKGFVVLPRRWVLERTFGWLGRWRRLSKDYEHLPEVSEVMLILAMIRLMLHRATHLNRKRGYPLHDCQNGALLPTTLPTGA